MAGIAEVARSAGIDTTGVKEVLEAIKKIAASESVVIKGFGTFKMKTRKARTAKNPQSGAEVLVPEKKEFTFKASKK